MDEPCHGAGCTINIVRELIPGKQLRTQEAVDQQPISRLPADSGAQAQMPRQGPSLFGKGHSGDTTIYRPGKGADQSTRRRYAENVHQLELFQFKSTVFRVETYVGAQQLNLRTCRVSIRRVEQITQGRPVTKADKLIAILNSHLYIEA